MFQASKKLYLIYSVRSLLTILFLLWFLPLSFSNDRGLYFYAHQSAIERRTSLLLHPGRAYEQHQINNLEIKFDAEIRRNERELFGYLLKIIDNKKGSFKLLLNNQNEVFLVISKPAQKDEFIKLKINQAPRLQVSLRLDRSTDHIILKINGQAIQMTTVLSDLKNLVFNFGQCHIEGFESNDVPPMTLRDVQLLVNGTLANHWQFDKYQKQVIYDQIEGAEATFNNGKMLIDKSVKWHKLGSISSIYAPQIAFDSIHNQLIVMDSTGARYFSPATMSSTLYPMKNIPGDRVENRLTIDYVNNKLLFYNFNTPYLNYFDSNSRTWTKQEAQRQDHSHHNSYISPKDTSLYLFGGYGHYKYNSDFIKINLRTGALVKKDLSASITPRYLAAMGANHAGDKLFVLGGKGAEMGLQELSSKSFSDLYAIDLKQMAPRLLIDNILLDKKNYGFSNHLILTENDRNMYVLTYPIDQTASYFQLNKIDMQTKAVEKYADSIPFHFKDDLSFCDLFYSPSLKMLLAVTVSSTDKVSSMVDIYAIDFPPLKQADLQYTLPAKSAPWKASFMLILGLGIVIGVFLYLRYRKQRQQVSLSPTAQSAPEQTAPATGNNLSTLASQSSKTVANVTQAQAQKKKCFYNRRQNSILFLGEFQVYDKYGKEYSESFSPILKHLLILILLYSIKFEKGISSSKLEEILWFDKSDKSATNNRNVNISKLRLLLESLDNVQIVNKSSNWSIKLPENVLSDYAETIFLAEKIKNDPDIDRSDVQRFLELTSYGELLPNIQFEWIDNFKSEFSNIVMDTLSTLIHSPKIAWDQYDSILLQITDSMFLFDPLSEEALYLKCKILFQQDKKTLAISTYENFIKRYQINLGEEFDKTFKEIVGPLL